MDPIQKQALKVQRQREEAAKKRAILDAQRRKAGIKVGPSAAIPKPAFEELKYVNGKPDPSLRPDQERMNFIKNGEAIVGASGTTTSEGVMNRPTLQTQVNAVTIHNNTKASNAILGQVIDVVNDLSGGSDADFGTRIKANEDAIAAHTLNIQENTQRIGQDGTEAGQTKTGLYKETDDNASEIGERNPLDVKNPSAKDDSLRSDNWFIKESIIGNKRNFDPNGNFNTDEYPTSTGIQGELEVHTNEINLNKGNISDHDDRITFLEGNTDIGDVSELREDMGERTDAGYDANRTVFARLQGNEDTNANQQTELDALNTTVNASGSGLSDRVATNEQNISNNTNSIQLNQGAIGSINTDIGAWNTSSGTLRDNIEANQTDIDNLETDVGSAGWQGEPSSLKYRVNTLETTTGNASSDTDVDESLWGYTNTFIKGTGTGSVKALDSRVTTLETGGTNYDPRISYLEGIVGSNDGTLGEGIEFKNNGGVQWQFADGATNPTLDVLNASHGAGVELGVSSYDVTVNADEVKLQANRVTVNDKEVVTTDGVDFQGAVTVQTPVNPQEPVTKLYGDDSYLAKTGGAVTGSVSVAGTLSVTGKATSTVTATADADLTRKDYVDQAVADGVSNADYLPTSGGTVTGDITIGNNDLVVGSAGSVKASTSTGDEVEFTTNSDSAVVQYTDNTSNTVHTLELGNDKLEVVNDGVTSKVYTEADKPTASDVGATEEAPSDGSFYSRQNGSWSEVPVQADATSDGNQYARKDGTWEVVDSIADSLNDGLYYVRRNGAWVQLAGDITVNDIQSGAITADSISSTGAVSASGFVTTTTQVKLGQSVDTSGNQQLGAVAIGSRSAQDNQGIGSVAIGQDSGQTDQGQFSTAIGSGAAEANQGELSVAVGGYAGRTNQGNSSIAMGNLAGETDQGNYGIVLNSTGLALNDTTDNHIHIATPSAELSYTDANDRFEMSKSLNVQGTILQNGVPIGGGGGGTGGIQIRGQVRASDGTRTVLPVDGDSLNSQIEQGVAPSAVGGGSPDGYTYIVTLDDADKNTGVELDFTGVTGSATTITVFDADQLVFAGDQWFHLETGDSVISVHGRFGAVIAETGDYTATQITNVPSGSITSNNVQSAIYELENRKLEDAPSDGNQYARQDGTWTPVTSSGGGGSDWQDVVSTTTDQGILLYRQSLTVPDVVSLSVRHVGSSRAVWQCQYDLDVSTDGSGTATVRFFGNDSDGTYPPILKLNRTSTHFELYLRPVDITISKALSVQAEVKYTDSSASASRALLDSTLLDWSTIAGTERLTYGRSFNCVANSSGLTFYKFSHDIDDLVADSVTTDSLEVNSSNIALGFESAQSSQGSQSVAIGYRAGKSSQGGYSTAVGRNAGETTQGSEAVAVGGVSGYINQSSFAVAVGSEAGWTGQGSASTSVGRAAGYRDQGDRSVAIGTLAGRENQGDYSVAMGAYSAYQDQGDSGIIIQSGATSSSDSVNDTTDNHIHIATPSASMDYTDATGKFNFTKPVQSEGVDLLTDAPSDGNQYARKDGAWSEVETYKEIATSNASTDGILFYEQDASTTDSVTVKCKLKAVSDDELQIAEFTVNISKYQTNDINVKVNVDSPIGFLSSGDPYFKCDNNKLYLRLEGHPLRAKILEAVVVSSLQSGESTRTLLDPTMIDFSAATGEYRYCNNTYMSFNKTSESRRNDNFNTINSETVWADEYQCNSTRTSLGNGAGGVSTHPQGDNAVAIGRESGGSYQNPQSIQATAIGAYSGYISQGESSVAVGYRAAYSNQGDNGIIINATGSSLDDTTDNHLHIATGSLTIDYTDSNGNVDFNKPISINGSPVILAPTALNALTDNKFYALQNGVWVDITSLLNP